MMGLLQVSIFKLMNSKKKYKKKKKKDLKAAGHINTSETLLRPETTVEDEIKSTKLQKKIQKLVKQQKLRLVGSILRQASSEEAWGPAIHAKVGNCLLGQPCQLFFVLFLIQACNKVADIQSDGDTKCSGENLLSVPG
jgi:hypothetical protein